MWLCEAVENVGEYVDVKSLSCLVTWQLTRKRWLKMDPAHDVELFDTHHDMLCSVSKLAFPPPLLRKYPPPHEQWKHPHYLTLSSISCRIARRRSKGMPKNDVSVCRSNMSILLPRLTMATDIQIFKPFVEPLDQLKNRQKGHRWTRHSSENHISHEQPNFSTKVAFWSTLEDIHQALWASVISCSPSNWPGTPKC